MEDLTELRELAKVGEELAAVLKCKIEEVPDKVQELMHRHDYLQKELRKYK